MSAGDDDDDDDDGGDRRSTIGQTAVRQRFNKRPLKIQWTSCTGACPGLETCVSMSLYSTYLYTLRYISGGGVCVCVLLSCIYIVVVYYFFTIIIITRARVCVCGHVRLYYVRGEKWRVWWNIMYMRRNLQRVGGSVYT